MSEPEKSHNTGAEEEQNEEVIQEGVEARAEQEVMGAEATRSATEEQQETIAKKKVQKRIAKEKKTSDSRRKKEEFGITSIHKQLEKQINYLARIRGSTSTITKVSQRLRCTIKSSKRDCFLR